MLILSVSLAQQHGHRLPKQGLGCLQVKALASSCRAAAAAPNLHIVISTHNQRHGTQHRSSNLSYGFLQLLSI